VQWVLESLLTATPAKTAVLLQRTEGSWKILALAGTVPDAWASAALSSAKDTPQLLPYMPIIERFQSGSNRESYLPTLQALPGRSEFTYLPDNTQAVLLIPVLTGDSTAAATAAATTTVLALGADQARSFTPRNVAWSQAVAAKLAAEMEESYS
jgi:Mg/Co/Ni transporter MgtE